MTREFWATAGDVAFNAFFLFTLLFVLLYAIISPWYRTQMGRNIMTLMGAIAATGVYSIYANWLSRRNDPEAFENAVRAMQKVQYPAGFWQIRFILFAILALAVVWRIMILVKAQLLARRNNSQPNEKGNDSHDLRP